MSTFPTDFILVKVRVVAAAEVPEPDRSPLNLKGMGNVAGVQPYVAVTLGKVRLLGELRSEGSCACAWRVVLRGFVQTLRGSCQDHFATFRDMCLPTLVSATLCDWAVVVDTAQRLLCDFIRERCRW